MPDEVKAEIRRLLSVNLVRRNYTVTDKVSEIADTCITTVGMIGGTERHNLKHGDVRMKLVEDNGRISTCQSVTLPRAPHKQHLLVRISRACQRM
jgi:hypothetical protein